MASSYQQFRLMPPTPKSVKYLVIFSLVFGCLAGFFHSLLGSVLNISFMALFSLSIPGLFKGFLWQPLTFLFLPQVGGSLSFYFLFSLCFDLYLLWFIGTKVCHLLGQKELLKLFFIPPIISALISVILSALLGLSAPLFGLSFAMIPLIIAYCFSHPEGHFHFMPLQALQTRWLGLGLIALYLIQDIANLDITALIAHILAVFTTYGYLKIFHKFDSPFSFLQKLERFFKGQKRPSSPKVVYLYEAEQMKRERKMDKTFEKMKRNQKLNIWDKIKLRAYRNK